MRCDQRPGLPTSASSSRVRSRTSPACSLMQAFEIELGPVERTGAVGAIESLYVRDPDGDLVELARPRPA